MLFGEAVINEKWINEWLNESINKDTILIIYNSIAHVYVLHVLVISTIKFFRKLE